MTNNSNSDIVILGGGSGGYACALRAAQLGKRVVLIERDELGGTCLHRGCVPTKALLHAAEIVDGARDAETFGVEVELSAINMAKVHDYKNAVVDRLHNGLNGLVKSSGITVVKGEGRLDSPNVVIVDGTTYRGTNVVLATGSHARSLPGVELGGRIVTSDQALTLPDVPTSVVVIGGSVIGAEFASVWRSFGAEVTIVEALPSLVPLEDPALSKQLERAFRRRGIELRIGTRVSAVEQDAVMAQVSLENGGQLQADLVLVAIGRGPASAGMGFAEVGVEIDGGHVATDAHLRTRVPGIYAVGDLVDGLQLAHRGFAHGIFVADHIAGLNPVPVVDADIPRVTYCDPEIGSVGMTELQAREAYGAVDTYEYNLGGNGKSQILATDGFVKLVRRKDGPIVGVHMIGARIGEQVGEAALMVNWEALPEDVAHFIHAHPTQNEALGEAAMALAGRPLHTHR